MPKQKLFISSVQSEFAFERAELYESSFFERLGTGTLDMFRLVMEAGLHEPKFIEDDEFRTIVYRKTFTGQVTGQVTHQVEVEITSEVKRLVSLLDAEMGAAELQLKLELSDRKYFRSNYLRRALDGGLAEMTIPEKPNSKSQKYRLTAYGKALKLKLKKK